MSWKSFWGWFKQGKIEPTNEVPFQEDDEIFKGIKITFPWWGEPKDKK